MRVLCCLAVLVLAGCATPLRPGAKSVRIVASDAAVQGMHLIDSRSGTIAGNRAFDLNNLAQNFGASVGASTVLVRRDDLRGVIAYTFEAWR